MKKTILTLAICAISVIHAQDLKIYKMNNGIKDLFPSTIVKQGIDQIEIYKTDSGIKDLFPSFVAKKENNLINLYEVNNGLRDLFPSQVIVPDTYHNAIPSSYPQPHYQAPAASSGFNARETAKNLNHLFPNSIIKFD